MGFNIKINSKEDFINTLKKLKELNVLGEEIFEGTYLPDSYLVSDVIDEKVSLYSSTTEYDDDVVEIAVSKPRKQILRDFNHLIGDDNIMVSLTTVENIEDGDVENKDISFDEIDTEITILRGLPSNIH